MLARLSAKNTVTKKPARASSSRNVNQQFLLFTKTAPEGAVFLCRLINEEKDIF